jgi:hypothetical protein
MEALLGPPGTAHPLLMARFGLTAIRSGRGARPRDASATSARARWLAGAAAHGMVPLDYASTAGGGARPGGRGALGRLAARARRLAAAGQRPRGRTCDRSAARSSRARASIRWRTCRRHASCLCDVTPRQFLRIGRRAGAGRRTGAGCSATATVPASSRWTGRCMRRCRGGRPAAPAPARSIWAARSPRIADGERARVGGDASTTGRTCCWSSRRCAIRHGRPPASTSSGPIAMSPRLDGRHGRSHREPDRALRARLP